MGIIGLRSFIDVFKKGGYKRFACFTLTARPDLAMIPCLNILIIVDNGEGREGSSEPHSVSVEYRRTLTEVFWIMRFRDNGGDQPC